MGRTCGGPNEIKKNTHSEKYYLSFCWLELVQPPHPAPDVVGKVEALLPGHVCAPVLEAVCKALRQHALHDQAHI